MAQVSPSTTTDSTAPSISSARKVSAGATSLSFAIYPARASSAIHTTSATSRSKSLEREMSLGSQGCLNRRALSPPRAVIRRARVAARRCASEGEMTHTRAEAGSRGARGARQALLAQETAGEML